MAQTGERESAGVGSAIIVEVAYVLSESLVFDLAYAKHVQIVARHQIRVSVPRLRLNVKFVESKEFAIQNSLY